MAQQFGFQFIQARDTLQYWDSIIKMLSSQGTSISQIESEIFKGTHFTAIAQGHGRPLHMLYAKKCFEIEGTSLKVKGMKVISLMAFL